MITRKITGMITRKITGMITRKITRKITGNLDAALIAEVISAEKLRDNGGPDFFPYAHLKLVHEAKELSETPSFEGLADAQICLEECADVLICLINSAKHYGFSTEDLATAVRNKTAINEARTWIQKPDGTWQHTTKTGDTEPTKEVTKEVTSHYSATITQAINGVDVIYRLCYRKDGIQIPYIPRHVYVYDSLEEAEKAAHETLAKLRAKREILDNPLIVEIH